MFPFDIIPPSKPFRNPAKAPLQILPFVSMPAIDVIPHKNYTLSRACNGSTLAARSCLSSWNATPSGVNTHIVKLIMITH